MTTTMCSMRWSCSSRASVTSQKVFLGESEALEKLEFGHFDVVLTDLLMPGMSGQELAREIRKRRPALPVVLMSVSPPRYPSDDIAGVLHKPFSLAELSSAIEAVC